MRIGIVSQWFDPEPGPASLPGELARELVRRGHDVQVVTGFPNYPTGVIYDGYRNSLRHNEVADGVKIRRVGIWPSHDASALGRVANLTSFGASVAASGLDCLKDRDAVWVSNSPPTIAWAVKRLHRWGVPVVLHVLDLWPDNIESSGLVGSSKLSAGMLRVVEGWNSTLYGESAKILTIAPTVADLLEERGASPEKISYSPLWANEAIFRPTTDRQRRFEMGVDDDTVVLLYAGAIGDSQGLSLLVSALQQVAPEVAEKLEVWFIGDGVGLPTLQREVAALPTGAPKVRLLGRKPMSEMPSWIAAADLCYVGLKADRHAEYSMPSKVQTTLAMGKPILAAVRGDVDRLVNDSGVGLATGSGDAVILGSLLTQMVGLGRGELAAMGVRAEQVYRDQFSLAAGAQRIEAALADAAGIDLGTAADDLTVEVADAADIAAIVAVHQRSFPNFFLTFLGPHFLRLFYEELQSDPQAVLLVAKRGRHVVGLVGGVQDESSFFASLKQRRGMEFARASALAALRRPSIVPRLWRARSRDEEKAESATPATLLTIAIEPSEQGRGSASALVERFVDAMAEIGVDSFTLTTDDSPSNRAIGFYRKSGFTQRRTFTTPEGRAMIEFEWTAGGEDSVQ